MTPFLILVMRLDCDIAVGTDLAFAAASKLAGAWQHARQGTVDWQTVRKLAGGSVPGALIAVAVLNWTQSHWAAGAERYLRFSIG
jgi:uncharacterized membrane protein YfcA